MNVDELQKSIQKKLDKCPELQGNSRSSGLYKTWAATRRQGVKTKDATLETPDSHTSVDHDNNTQFGNQAFGHPNSSYWNQPVLYQQVLDSFAYPNFIIGRSFQPIQSIFLFK